MRIRFVKNRVDQEFALLEPPAGQRFHVQGELRAKPAQDLLDLVFVSVQKQRREHSFAPGRILGSVPPVRLQDRPAKLFLQLLILRAQRLRA